MFSFTSSIPVVGTHHDVHGGDAVDKSYGVGGSESGGGAINAGKAEGNNADSYYSPIVHCILAGGIGGAIGDSAMHSLDTVKTRQQGAPGVLKYRQMFNAYRYIVVEEGIARGLYGGYCAAMLGSFPSAAIFFGTYEFVKRKMIDDWSVNDTTSHLGAGFLGDLFSSVVYVPSEVLKARLQLQGRYNNIYFDSGYNYRNLRDAIYKIVTIEGVGALFFGYKATLARDLPFSALQFAFYEKFRRWAFSIEGKPLDHDLSIASELITGASAGGLAGILTTPLDVIKTRIQTQSAASRLSNSVSNALVTVYKAEGIRGVFGGVGPRFIWTSIQSSIMLLLYQTSLKALNSYTSAKHSLD